MYTGHPSIRNILPAYGLQQNHFNVVLITSGYIHQTYKLVGRKSFILQRISTNVFTEPASIASNIRIAADYLRSVDPDFFFLTPVKTITGEDMAYDDEGFPWRLYPYIENSFALGYVGNEEHAFLAAAAFGRLTRKLNGVSISLFKTVIDRFHDLSWRWQQFEQALGTNRRDRLAQAADTIEACRSFRPIVDEYEDLVRSGKLVLRITHNDAKISNVLFDSTTGAAICPIDLDTLMPGYFIYDVGDMVRTFVSPVGEEERDLSYVTVRQDIYDGLIRGYLSEMNDVLTSAEKDAIHFAGRMMTYIMALRMLTDYLNGDVYYVTRYEDQNLVRSKNQVKLLQELSREADVPK